MAVVFLVTKPSELVAQFKSAIEKGEIKTWKWYEGDLFTHASAQFHGKAFFYLKKADTASGALMFNICKPPDRSVDRVTYAYYHSHLIEALLTHFAGAFENGVATAKATVDDTI